MKYQSGVTLSGLLIWGFIIAVVALLGMRVAPEVIDYYKIKKIVASTAVNANGKTVPEIRAIFGKYADVGTTSRRLLPQTWISPRKATKSSYPLPTKNVSPCS